MSLVDQVGHRLGDFLRWLVARGDWSVQQLIDLIDDPGAWEPEFAEFESETTPAPSLDQLAGEDRAAR